MVRETTSLTNSGETSSSILEGITHSIQAPTSSSTITDASPPAPTGQSRQNDCRYGCVASRMASAHQVDWFSKRMSDSEEAESLQESSPGLEWRSHANPGFATNKTGRSERAQEKLRTFSRTLSECCGPSQHEPRLCEPGLHSQGPFRPVG